MHIPYKTGKELHSMYPSNSCSFLLSPLSCSLHACSPPLYLRAGVRVGASTEGCFIGEATGFQLLGHVATIEGNNPPQLNHLPATERVEFIHATALQPIGTRIVKSGLPNTISPPIALQLHCDTSPTIPKIHRKTEAPHHLSQIAAGIPFKGKGDE